MGAWVTRLIDDRGNEFNTKDLEKMYGLSNSYISQIIREDKLTTLLEFSNRWKQLEMNRRHIIYIRDVDGKKYQLNQIGPMFNRSRSWVVKVYRLYGLTTLEEFKDYVKSPKSLRMDTGKPSPIFVTPPDFNRGKVCYRHNFMVKCIHYTSCADARISGAHHKRYKMDGSCFNPGQKYDGRYEGYEAFGKT